MYRTFLSSFDTLIWESQEQPVPKVVSTEKEQKRGPSRLHALCLVHAFLRFPWTWKSSFLNQFRSSSAVSTISGGNRPWLVLRPGWEVLICETWKGLAWKKRTSPAFVRSLTVVPKTWTLPHSQVRHLPSHLSKKKTLKLWRQLTQLLNSARRHWMRRPNKVTTTVTKEGEEEGWHKRNYS